MPNTLFDIAISNHVFWNHTYRNRQERWLLLHTIP